MFSVYGKGGRVFSGSMEELRRVGPTAVLSRAARVTPVAAGEPQESTSHFAEITQRHGREASPRGVAEAYAQASHTDARRHPLRLVSDIMTKEVFTLPDSLTIAQAWKLLAERRIGQAPVVGADGVLVGILTRSELMRPDRLPGPDTHALVWKAQMAQSVTEWMLTPVPSVAADTDIPRVARVLLDTGLPGLPDVDYLGQVEAFVSRSDILRAVVADPPLDLWT